MVQRALQFAELEGGCHVPITHALNQDGYFRRGTGKVGRGRMEMFHRTVWRLHNGDIPAGFEVDHLCRNRACCNVAHLQCIPGDQHAIKTNETRYAARKEEARAYWEQYHPTGTRLGQMLGVSFGTACRWVREWKAETH